MSNPEIQYRPSELLSEVQPIKQSRNKTIFSRAEIKDLVESPLLSAAEILFDKNIKTTESTANFEDIKYGKRVGIVIDYDALSPENQKIADNIDIGRVSAHPDGYTSLELGMSVDENTTAEQITNTMESAVNQFAWQPLFWMPGRTLEEMKKLYAIDAHDETYQPEDFTEYYDAETHKFYFNEEHYKRAIATEPQI